MILGFILKGFIRFFDYAQNDTSFMNNKVKS